MANKFLVFDENGSNIMTDAEYQAATQRIGGVLPGLAEPTMHNKLYRQTSIMAAAIGRVLAQYNLDAPDDDLATLANNIKSLFCFNVLDAYPVGAIYISASAVNPSQLFGGTWEQVQGKFLLSASANYPAGTTGGEANHTLTASEMPSHSHGITIGENGWHGHSASIGGAGNHTHGFDQPLDEVGFDVTGGGAGPRTRMAMGDNWPYEGNVYNVQSLMWGSGDHTHAISLGGAGNHAHAASAANTGGNAPHNNMPPYLSVYVWKRTA